MGIFILILVFAAVGYCSWMISEKYHHDKIYKSGMDIGYEMGKNDGYNDGHSKGYEEGYNVGFKAGNEGGLTSDEKESIRQVLAVLTFGADKQNED